VNTLRGIVVRLAFATAILLATAGTLPLPAQTFAVVHDFTGRSDGFAAYGGLILDSAGNLYGTTGAGGIYGWGTVFTMDQTGAETVLHHFTGGADGAAPVSSLIRESDGSLYGTTAQGGGGNCFGGCGTIFKLDAGGTLTTLYSFTGGGDGRNPWASLVKDAAGNFYGTAVSGGAYSFYGTVFRLNKNHSLTTLHSFSAKNGDGAQPQSGVLLDSHGNLYGTTAGGGKGYGTIYRISKSGAETILYSFTGGNDGAAPYAGLVRDTQGNFYGAAQLGGASGTYGTVFKFDTAGKLTTLHSFSGTDGQFPVSTLVRDKNGNLYGTTYGNQFACQPDYGCGTVFELDTNQKLTTLHGFTRWVDGAEPYAGLVQDSAGSLYGATQYGGLPASPVGTLEFGAVFKLVP